MLNEDEIPPLNLQSWSTIESMHPNNLDDATLYQSIQAAGKKFTRSYGARTMNVAKSGVSATQYVGGYNGLTAVAMGGGMAISATGIGLFIAAGVMTVANTGLAIKSARSTHLHIRGLEQIDQNPSQYRCEACQGGSLKGSEHSYISNTILPHLIAQKKLKRARKGVKAVPVVGGLLSGGHSVKNNLIKRIKGTKGRKRCYYGDVLARHLITHNCQLSFAIVAEIFSESEALRIMRMNSADAGKLISSKMKSK